MFSRNSSALTHVNRHKSTSFFSLFANTCKSSSRTIKYTLLVLTAVSILYFTFGVVWAQVTSGVWSTEVSLPIALQEVSVAALESHVYVVGGSTSQARS